MAKKLIPLLNRVLVQKIVAPMGPGGRAKDESTILDVVVREGDTVLLPEYGGSQLKLGDEEFVIFQDEEILGILKD
ncbi:hypothetical protein GOP47_0002619 [Adiantum capillus-veneris]|uniref:10 kDa chaperonin n=1 Tax=Adiantum capillus-veneris TaxID=13818 RepID=A0A9D4VAF4_ADICA|nr:hypothetical protein GOP47_0002619 [Adiantum capillus-veneris]